MIRDERGSMIVMSMVIMTVLGLLATTIMHTTFADLNQTQSTLVGDRSLQAAEAGVDDYIAKLTDDHTYYDHYVATGEASRLSSVADGSVTRDEGNAWGLGTWTYPNGRDNWRALGNGTEYDLQIEPPCTAISTSCVGSTHSTVRITSTGRKTGDDTTTKTIQVEVRPTLISDFQMAANRDISYASGKVTDGKIYAGIDDQGVAHNISHAGTANADLYAEGTISGATTFGGDAAAYPSATIRTKLQSPIDFGSFVESIGDVRQAATSAGLVLDNTAYAAWMLTFTATGTVGVQGCTLNVTSSVTYGDGDKQPTCGTTTTYNVPTNGAIYTGQDAMVKGVVNGRVTVASADDILLGGSSLTYNSGSDDILGLIARNDVVVPLWLTTTATWTAAAVAVGGQCRSFGTTVTSTGPMSFTGSIAANEGGVMTQFPTRTYAYDTDLLTNPPPYFPVLPGTYTIQLFREVSS